MRSPIFTIPSGSTDSFQEHENDTFEAEDGHEEDLLDFAVSRLNGSILDEALTHVAQRTRQGSSSAASTLKPLPAIGVVRLPSSGGEPSMTEEREEDHQPDEMPVSSPVTVVVDAIGEEARLKANVRRYYALMELFETEKGYLNDLRVLVEVYLTSLGAVHPSSTPCENEEAVPSRGHSPSPLHHQLSLQPQHPPICSLSPIGSYDGFDEPEEELHAQPRPAAPIPQTDALSHVAPAIEAEGDAHASTSGEVGSSLGRRASMAANPKRISPLHPPSAFPSQQLQSTAPGNSGVAIVGASVMPQAQAATPRSRKRSLSLSLGLIYFLNICDSTQHSFINLQHSFGAVFLGIFFLAYIHLNLSFRHVLHFSFREHEYTPHECEPLPRDTVYTHSRPFNHQCELNTRPLIVRKR
ncbi:hypothetical protein SCHPADRAFT_902017 [Schizopora paradoxa]|uniref:DH domain-containing protein n=1 Tax=Schizopora paradoxa TaxID=27342 RepID=A0A0H2S2E1_9AGAM|nr:hypothetical protein SCHPADRAFT_902017 [Schizopora paradoxa]